MNGNKNDTDQLKKLLSDIHTKGNTDATLKDVMTLLKTELPKITKQGLTK